MNQTATIQQTRMASFIRMSSAGKCRRQTGYEALGYPESDPTPLESKNVMELGDGAEAILVQRLREEGWEVDLTRWDGGEQLEVRLNDPPRVGHPDGRCRHPELTRNLWVLLECKGMNAFQYRAFLRDGVSKSHPQYLDQVAQYTVALRQAGLVANACVAVVAVLDRDTGRWGYQRVRWAPEVFEARTIELAEAWEDIINRGQLPERDHDGATWHCSPRYCRWSSLCWAAKRPAPYQEEVGGSLDGATLDEAGELAEAVDLWRQGKDLETRGKALQEDGRRAFREVLERYKVKRLTADGLAATLVTTDRRSWDEKALRRFLTEEQLHEAQRITPTTSLRVTDTEGDSSS